MVVQVVVPPIPAELIVVAAGRQYGVVTAGLVAGGGLFTGSVAVYGIGWWLRRRFDRFFEGDKVSRVLAALDGYGALLLWVRILPYNPSDLISYAAGILRLRRRLFVPVTAVTSLVRCLTLAWLGTTIQDWSNLLPVAGLLVLSAGAAHWLVYGRSRD